MKRNFTRNSNRGFTLVELLVVIAIIGVLVGLLVPAVNFARQTARKAECLNNIRGIGQSIMLYENDKQHFPGRVNVVRANAGHSIHVSWVTRILPYMEQGNVWDLVINDPDPSDNPDDPTRYAVDLGITTCPSDPPLSTKILAPLNYVINTGVWDRDFGSNSADWRDLRANGISHVLEGPHSQSKVDLGYIAKNDGTSTTLLASENVNAVTWVSLEEGLHGIVWTLQDQWLEEKDRPTRGRQFQINVGKELFLDEQLLTMSASGDVEQLESLARPSSNHSGGVNAVFCDGHASFISEDVNAGVYAQLMSTSRSQARHPANGGNNWQQTPIPLQLTVTLSDGDY